ncbi:MAG: hypothetical protein K2G75_00555 [Muribaculaceae bacterium]|nr:hypothetical protein [Muribaculaceae bacterium]MDE5923787.1 hypothetical protein [Muribaculaceae bacterium]MDE6330054.1 hypothetical protein [Muribaculaceae bacterium]
MQAIHLKTALEMLNEGKPVTLTALTAKGEINTYEECVALPRPGKKTWRNYKMLRSGQIRRIRDVLIIGINEFEVYL